MTTKRTLPQSGGTYERKPNPDTKVGGTVLVQIEPGTLPPVGKTEQKAIDAAKAKAEASAATPVPAAPAPSANTGDTTAPTAKRMHTRGEQPGDNSAAKE
jgi:hypothetical protein